MVLRTMCAFLTCCLLIMPTPAATAASATDDWFYQPPAVFAAQAGSVIRTQPIPGMTATKMLYTSTNQFGEPVAVSGYVIEPPTLAIGTVVFAPSTRGQGDLCAPSRGPLVMGTVSSTNLAVNYELPVQYAALAAGLRVVVTDYIGLGTPGIHTYVNSVEEAHAVLDAARAGLRVAGVPADSPVGLHGYSQGGGAVAAAAELHATYAPELQVVGTYSGAPPADLQEVFTTVDGSLISGVLGMAINGFGERDPEFRAAVERHLSGAGREYLRTMSTSCVIDAIGRYGFVRSNAFTNTGEDFAGVLAKEPVVAATLKRNSLGKQPPRAPIFVATGQADDIIPTGQAKRLAQQYCAAGATVTFRQSPLPRVTPQINSALNHGWSSLDDLKPSIDYLLAHFRGGTPHNDCGNL